MIKLTLSKVVDGVAYEVTREWATNSTDEEFLLRNKRAWLAKAAEAWDELGLNCIRKIPHEDALKLAFPTLPSQGQLFTYSGATWVFKDNIWYELLEI